MLSKRHKWYLLFAAVFIVAAVIICIMPSKGNAYKQPISGDQIAEAIDAFFGSEVKSLDWDAVITEKGGKKTFILSDARGEVKSPSEAFGEGNDYFYYRDIKGRKDLVFPNGIEKISVCWSRKDGDTDYTYNAFDTNVDGVWDKVLVLPANTKAGEYDSVVLDLSGPNTAKKVEKKYLESTLLVP